MVNPSFLRFSSITNPGKKEGESKPGGGKGIIRL